MLLELVDGDVRPLLDELLAPLVQPLLQDNVAHGQGHEAVGPGLYEVPLVAPGRRVGEPDIEGDEFCTRHLPPHHPLGEVVV